MEYWGRGFEVRYRTKMSLCGNGYSKMSLPISSSYPRISESYDVETNENRDGGDDDCCNSCSSCRSKAC